jgi:hypothetical protein
MFKNTQNIKCPMCRNPLTRSEVNAIVDKNLNLITGDDMKKKLETKMLITKIKYINNVFIE